MAQARVTVGLISDTHGLLRPEALRALAGVQRIVHAGDIGGPEILSRLSAIAPVDAVRGNNDIADWAAGLPDHLTLQIEGVRVHVVHDIKKRESAANESGGYEIVVAGHSHHPSVVRQGGLLFVNPGSAGPRRFRLPVAVGILEVSADAAEARILEIG